MISQDLIAAIEDSSVVVHSIVIDQ